MDDFERDKMLACASQLRDRELEPFSWDDPFSDMGTDEKSKLLLEFMNQNHSLKEIVELLKSERTSSLDYKAKFEEEHKLNISLQSRLDNLLQTIDSLREQVDLMNQHRYGSKTQKRNPTQSNTACADHTKDKDDFDGTPGSIGMDSTSAASAEEPNEQTSVKAEKEFRYYRQGMEYRAMKADKTVCHRSDLNRLPAGATVIKVLHRYSYEQVSSIIEHDYELIRYKTLEGSIIDGYLPCDGASEVIDVVPGMHASSSFLAYLAFNKYVLDTPLYRELVRMMDEQMQVSRMTLTNWLEKGSKYVNALIKILKDHCLEKDSIVNCDETWCRVKVDDSYKKKYIWCLVNKAAKVVIYCYEDGSRGRDALRRISLEIANSRRYSRMDIMSICIWMTN
ncbi:transposase [Bacteroides sp.]|uniref:IS66 family transposase n=1 Tax=Bacteroides sp. TaxID=29523 RepID=UPI0025BA1BD4|nr:transposase [Bacteroides sp.]